MIGIEAEAWKKLLEPEHLVYLKGVTPSTGRIELTESTSG